MRIVALFLYLSFTVALYAFEIKYEITVAQDGSGDYTTIQDAIDATKSYPPKRITIYIKNGIYNEKVCVPEWNTKLSLVGESKEGTIITYNDHFKKIDRGRNSTFFTYTLKIEADDFYAENLTIRNTAGTVGQAVALHVDGNRCKFVNCSIEGNQDTLYAAGQNSLQYYVSCTIEGTTDFIFGAATAYFGNCTIHSKSNSYITAASTPYGKLFGFVFYKCRLTAAPEVSSVYLGRPWRENAKVVYIECEMGSHIHPEGWKVWSNSNNLNTTYYAEYANTGPGAKTDKRVEWCHLLSYQEANNYSVINVLSPAINNSDYNWILQTSY